MVGSHFDNSTLDLSNARITIATNLCVWEWDLILLFILFFKTFLVVYETSQFEQCLIPKLAPNFNSKIQNYKLPKKDNPFENVEASSFAFFHSWSILEFESRMPWLILLEWKCRKQMLKEQSVGTFTFPLRCFKNIRFQFFLALSSCFKNVGVQFF
jgi:hypothetical protein